MTGVDLSTDFLQAARAKAAEQRLEVVWEERNMQELPWQGEFDGAFCFGNSFGFFTDEEDQKFLHAVAEALKPGARFVLDTKCAETVFPRFQERQWYEGSDMTVLVHDEYDPPTGRTDSEYTFLTGEKRRKDPLPSGCIPVVRSC